jgi:hypothetical protein
LQTEAGGFEIQAALRGPPDNDALISRPQIQGYFWHHRQTMWPPAGQLFLGRADTAGGSKTALDHSSGAIHVTEDKDQYGFDEIESPIDLSAIPSTSVTSGKEIRTSHLRLQGDWIYRRDDKIIWLPPELRPYESVNAVRGAIMAFGCSAGNVSLWEMIDL